MAVALIVAPGDEGKLAQLTRRQRAIGNSDAKHIGMKLQIDAIHQTKRTELLLGQFARKPASDLITKLRRPGSNKAFVELIVTVHFCRLTPMPPAECSIAPSPASSHRLMRRFIARSPVRHRRQNALAAAWLRSFARSPALRRASPVSQLGPRKFWTPDLPRLHKRAGEPKNRS